VVRLLVTLYEDISAVTAWCTVSSNLDLLRTRLCLQPADCLSTLTDYKADAVIWDLDDVGIGGWWTVRRCEREINWCAGIVLQAGYRLELLKSNLIPCFLICELLN